MALEDFFTLTEMKDGLSTLARVEELISLMQKQRDCAVSIVNDAARQWSAVVGTLAATQNTACLTHFVNLKGLWFLNEWLQEIQKWSIDTSDNVLEKLVSSLLTTLERLPVERDQLAVSGIGVTIQGLLDNKNPNIKEKAKKFSHKLNDVVVSNLTCHDLDNGICVNNQLKCSVDANNTEGGVTPSKGGNGEAICEIESTATESQHSNVTRYSTNSQMDIIKDVKSSMPDQIMLTTSLDSAGRDAVGEMNSLGSSLASKSCPQNLSVIEDSSICAVVGLASAVACSSPVCRVNDADDDRDVSGLKEAFDGMEGMEMEVSIKECNPCKPNEEEAGNISSFSGLSASLSKTKEAMEPLVSCNFNTKEAESCNAKIMESQAMSEDVYCGLPTDLITSKDHQPITQLNKIPQEISCNEPVPINISGPEDSCHREEPVGSGGDNNDFNKEADSKVNAVDIATPNVSSRAVGLMNQKSQMRLEYEEIDALEVAWQVALEVEREVVDYREPFCSSPEVNSGEATGNFNPQGKQDIAMIEELDNNRLSSRKEMSDGTSSPKEPTSQILGNICTDLVEHEQILEIQKAASVALGSVDKSDQNICDFDLNEDICTEEFDSIVDSMPNNPVNISVPVAVVATSKGASSLPATPLQFEGEMGWKGSAVTSAFRPACSRVTPDCEKVSSELKQKSVFLEIDLNVVETEHDVAIDPISAKQMPVSSGLPSWDSSIEVSSWRAERLKLDLNRLGDDEMSMNPSSYWRPHHHNGDQSVSSASSSSSRYPSLREFDLNDVPCLLDAGASHNTDKVSSKVLTMYGSPKVDDLAITILGSKMAVERKEYVNQTHHSFLCNGMNMEAGMAARAGLTYAHMTPPYAYNGHVAGSSMAIAYNNGHVSGPSMAIAPAFYGPGSIPYMDPRRTTVVPQVLGSTGLSLTSSMKPPFVTSLNGSTPGINGIGPSRSGLNLNSGLTLIDSGSREGGSLKHLFIHGHNGSVEEEPRTGQPSSSGTSLKRKEPEYGWEPYALGYNQATSWQ